MYNYILILIFILFAYVIYEIKCLKKEHFDSTSDIKDAVKAVYKADIEAIRNLSSIASSLTANNNLTLPADFKVTGASNFQKDATFGGNATISGNLNIGPTSAPTFTVDTKGNVICNSIKIGGYLIKKNVNDDGSDPKNGASPDSLIIYNSKNICVMFVQYDGHLYTTYNGWMYGDKNTSELVRNNDKIGIANGTDGWPNRLQIPGGANWGNPVAIWSGVPAIGNGNQGPQALSFGNWETLKIVKL